VRRISVDDMKAQHKRLIARSTLKVIVVGDIGRAEAIAAIDRIFGGLPAEAKLERIARPAMQGALAPVVVIKEQPLATAAFGLAALDSGHADYPALQVLNHIMGSGDFDSTLMEEIRVKRGLAYSVQLSLIHDQAASVMLGGMATKNENMREALAVLRTILEATAANGPTPEQFENARKYLTGSYLLDFDTNAKLGSSLLRIWLEGKGPDFIDKRNAGIDRVTLADVKRVARDILKPDRLIVTVVGQPKL
jgi:zinc protease